MSDSTTDFVPDHVKAKQHAEAVRARREPIPQRIEVHLPVGRVATATNYKGETFQPDEVEWQAILDDVGVLVTAAAVRSKPFACQTFYPSVGGDVPDWFPAAPAWFVAELARMERVAEHDRRTAKREDHLAEGEDQ
ncbi:hypothetical protein [Janibacter terrae]|uniref:hypothetical protein n=1 Tax=Janibacter terrae TaxID=103817 RepID=UPI0031F9612B